MSLPKKDLKIEYMRGSGPGGQRKNKKSTACRITHKPTGISAYADERSQSHSKKKALAELEKRIEEEKTNKIARDKKQRRDDKIKNSEIIRTYDYKNKVVKDHRTGKRARLEDIIKDARIDLFR